MIEALGIAASDGLNRKNHYIRVEALLNAYKDAWKYGVPSSINHDSTKFIGWTFFSGIYFEPGKAYVTNKFYEPENQEEMDKLKNYSSEYHTMRCIKERAAEYEKLRNLLGDVLGDSFRIVPMYHAVAYEDTNVVIRAIPELTQFVNDGMIEMKYLHSILPGVYEFGEYVVFAHRYFRRSGSVLNGLNREFLERFDSIDEKYNPRIAIDLDIIGLKDSVSDEFEYAYWWGPKFNDDLSKIEEGVTRHENTRYDELFSNVKTTDFYWYTHDGAKTFECEELNCRAIMQKGTESYNCRYVHSRLDANGCIDHLDGAIRSYCEESMITRMDKKLDEVDHDAEYKKLWRIDGKMDLVIWKELITHYFRDNTLVGEYLGGRDENFEQILIDDKKEKIKERPVKKYIPVNIEKGNGLRFFLSYRRKKENQNKCSEYTVKVRALQSLSLDEGISFRPIIESDTITLLKNITRNGGKTRIPYALRVAHEDMIFNLPIIECDSVRSASIVLKSLFELIQVFVAKRDDRLLSISLSVSGCIEDDVVVSFAGHVDDYYNLFSSIGTDFPDRDGLDHWIVQLYSENTNIGTKPNTDLKVYDLLNREGFLIFERALVPERYLHGIRRRNNGIYCEFKASKDDLEELKNLHIGIAPAYLVKKSICSKCGMDYIACNCVKFIEDVSENMKDVSGVGMYWTNRHAQNLYLTYVAK